MGIDLRREGWGLGRRFLNTWAQRGVDGATPSDGCFWRGGSGIRRGMNLEILRIRSGCRGEANRG